VASLNLAYSISHTAPDTQHTLSLFPTRCRGARHTRCSHRYSAVMTDSTQPITLVIADDHPAFRSGIRTILEKVEAVDIVGETGTGRGAIRLITEHKPTVLLLDIELPDISGLEVAREIQRLEPSTRILALSSYDDTAYVRGLMQAGAAGYITKEKATGMIGEAVSAVARGEGRWFVSVEREPSLIEHLTAREKDVLKLLAEGCSNPEIAGQLFLAENTVRKHASRVYEKLGVSSAREAIACVWQNGIVDEL